MLSQPHASHRRRYREPVAPPDARFVEAVHADRSADERSNHAHDVDRLGIQIVLVSIRALEDVLLDNEDAVSQLRTDLSFLLIRRRAALNDGLTADQPGDVS